MSRTSAFRRAAAWTIGLAGALSASAAHAGGAEFGINIDIDRPVPFIADLPSSTYGAAANQPGTWNLVRAAASGTTNLVGLTGLATGVQIQQFGSGNSNASCVGGIVQIDYSNLMCDYAYAVTGVPDPLNYTIKFLPPGQYDVYVYASRPSQNALNNLVNWTVGTTSIATKTINGTYTTQTFQEGLTHVRQVCTIPVGGADLKIAVFDGSGEFGDPIGCGGIQIVRVDEPTAAITSPTFQDCICSPANIIGSVGSGQYWLEWSATGDAPWTLINAGNGPITNGTLGTWDATGLPEGLYAIRLSAQNSFGNEATAFTTAYLNQAFTFFSLSSPSANAVYGGDMCIGGTIWDECFSRWFAEFAPSGTSSYQPVEPGMPFYTNTIINQTGAVWDTTTVPDGMYNIRVRAFDECHPEVSQTIPVKVDNTPPIAQITSPVDCTQFCGQVFVIGTATDANLAGWVLQHSSDNGWVTISSGNTPVVNGLLGTWNTAGLPKCAYTLRLVVSDSAIIDCNGVIHHSSEDIVSVIVAPEGDVTFDGVVNVDDLNVVLSNWLDTCN